MSAAIIFILSASFISTAPLPERFTSLRSARSSPSMLSASSGFRKASFTASLGRARMSRLRYSSSAVGFFAAIRSLLSNDGPPFPALARRGARKKHAEKIPENFFRVSVILCRVYFTYTLAVAFMPPHSAVSVVLPALTPLTPTVPSLLTVILAMLSSPMVHLTSALTSLGYTTAFMGVGVPPMPTENSVRSLL